MKTALFLIAFILCVIAAPAMAASGTTTSVSLDERFMLVYTLANLPANTCVLIALHGATGNGSTFESQTDFDDLGDDTGCIVVHPYGSAPLWMLLSDTWNGGSCCGQAQAIQINDVGFIRNIIAYMKQNYSIDPTKVYLAGHSTGAIMSYRYLCTRPQDIAGALLAAGALVSDRSYCASPVNVPITAVYGDDDLNLPPLGGLRLAGNYFPPFASTKSFLEARGATFTVYELASTGHPYADLDAALGTQFSTSMKTIAEAMTGTYTPAAHQYYSDAATQKPYTYDVSNSNPYQYSP